MASCTILILTYKGKHHLELLLPTVDIAIQKYSGNAVIDVMIVDNGCDESTRGYTNSNYPQYNYYFSTENDYLFSLNAFIEGISSDFVLMLNDDMKLEKNVLNELLPIIENDRELFAVTCRIMDFEGTYTASAVRSMNYTRGWVYEFQLDHNESELKYTLFPGGGAAIFRTAYFNALNGFDTLYRPAYAEDLDLGTRAWQKNWRTVYNPNAVLYHREGGTINDQFKRNKLEQIICRNRILWMVKTGRYPGFLFWFFLMLPYRLVFALFNNKNQYKAFLQALRKLKPAIQKRKASENLNNSNWAGMLNQTYP